jgi:hypothetical protein
MVCCSLADPSIPFHQSHRNAAERTGQRSMRRRIVSAA